MALISPFMALRPQAQHARQLASRPYDVLSSKEARQEAQGNPNSFLHITKSEIDLPEDTDPHSSAVYEKAKQNLDAFIQRGLLFQESKPCYYIYRLLMDGRSQTGLVCASSIADYDNGIIKKHEFTRPEKELDRINHIKTTGAQTGNVFLAYRDVDEINAIIAKWANEKSPVYDFVADDEVAHTIWVISDERLVDQISTVFKEAVPCTYIADGHHRAASAAKVKQQMGEAGAATFLTTLFPASELKILDYNRVVKDLAGWSVEDLVLRVAERFEVEAVASPLKPQEPHEFGMYVGGHWYRLRAKAGSFATDPIGILDVTILHDQLLHPILGIGDERTDKRIDFVGGIRGLGELESRVDSGDSGVAFSLYPVSIQQLFDIADSGNVMPPKSTWFEPKLRDGLLTHLIQ